MAGIQVYETGEETGCFTNSYSFCYPVEHIFIYLYKLFTFEEKSKKLETAPLPNFEAPSFALKRLANHQTIRLGSRIQTDNNKLLGFLVSSMSERGAEFVAFL